MRLNKSTNQAIQILIECATSDGELTKVAELSERLGITIQNTFKIVHILSQANFLASVRGRNGGVQLAKTARDIRIGDVVREIEAGLAQDRTGTTKVESQFDNLIDDAFSAFLEVLDGQTLEDLATVPRRKKSKPKAKSAASKVRLSSSSRNNKKLSSKRALSARA